MAAGLPEKNHEIVLMGVGNSGKTAFVNSLDPEKYTVVSYKHVYKEMMQGFEEVSI